MVISVDHGNKQIKTMNHIFTSGYIEGDTLPSLGNDTLKYEGKTYMLDNRRFPQSNDKTIDEHYFILTLFAIAKELQTKFDTAPTAVVDVALLAGLPPLHYKALHKKFEEYFIKREPRIVFEYNGQAYWIAISDVCIYPQAYAASLTARDEIKDSIMANIVDIGGYTVDCLLMERRRPNMSVCTSLHGGVNILFDQINAHIRSKIFKNLPDQIIESIISNEKTVLDEYPSELVEIVRY